VSFICTLYTNEVEYQWKVQGGTEDIINHLNLFFFFCAVMRGFNIALDTLQDILMIIFTISLLTGTKHPPAFSTNHLTDIDKTKHG